MAACIPLPMVLAGCGIAGIIPSAFLVLVTIGMSVCPLYYTLHKLEISEECLRLVFRCRTIAISLNNVQSAEVYTMPRGTIRLFGGGAFFGWWGDFRNKELGSFKLYATATKNLVLLRLKNGRKIVVSSPDPQALCDAILKFKR